MSKDVALDNLWNTIDDTFVYHTVGYPAKMVKKSGNTLTSKRTKLQGYMSYFLPKDKKGKVIGKPQKFLRIQRAGKTTNDFIPAELAVPYYEDILKNRNYWISLGGSNLVAQAQNKLSGVGAGSIASNFNGVDITNADDYGINSSLIDSGSLLNVGDDLPQVNYSSINAMETISDPNVAVVDVDTMNQAYQQSGSKSKFSDWLNSTSGKGIVNELAKLGNAIINKPTASTSATTTPSTDTKTDEDKDKIKTETKILGMSPVTFGFVALGVIAIASIVTIALINKKTKVKVS